MKAIGTTACGCFVGRSKADVEAGCSQAKEGSRTVHKLASL